MPNTGNYPSSAIEALAMLYLSKSDIAGLSPAELVSKYNSVYKEISKTYNATKNERNIHL